MYANAKDIPVTELK